MAKQLQLRRGTTSQHSSFTGLVGEVTVDTDKDTAVVHDGSTAGGKPLATAAIATNSSITTLGTVTAGTLSHGTTVQGWVDASNTGATFPAGHIIQVIMGGITSPVTQAGNSSKNTVAGFNVSITPHKASSKILLHFNFDYCASTSVTALAFLEREIAGGGWSELTAMQGDDPGGALGDPAIGHAGGVTEWKSDNCAGMYLDAPSYTVTNLISYRIGSYAESNQVVHFGKTHRDSSAFHPRCRSTLIAMEVAQ